MPFGIRLFHKFRLILGICISIVTAVTQIAALAAPVDKDFGSVIIILPCAFAFIFLGKFSKFHQRKLNLFMPGNFVTCAILAKQCNDFICETLTSHIKPVIRVINSFPIACICHYAFQEMTGIVHLMVREILPAVCPSRFSAGISRAAQREECVNIAVRVLDFLDFLNPAVQFVLKLLPLCLYLLSLVILSCGERIGKSLDTLINIGILEHESAERLICFTIQFLYRIVKIRFPAGRLADFQDCLIQGSKCISLLLGRPESIVQLYVFKGYGTVGFRCCNRLLYRNLRCRRIFLVIIFRLTRHRDGLPDLIGSIACRVHGIPCDRNQFSVKALAEVDIIICRFQGRRRLVKNQPLCHYGIRQDRRYPGSCCCLVFYDFVHTLHMDCDFLLPVHPIPGNGKLQCGVAGFQAFHLHLGSIRRSLDSCHFRRGDGPLEGSVCRHRAWHSCRGIFFLLVNKHAIVSGYDRALKLIGHFAPKDFPFADAKPIRFGSVALHVQTNPSGRNLLGECQAVPHAAFPIDASMLHAYC